MEVCDLNECDFLETEINTYDSVEDFQQDGSFQISKSGKYKGVIMYFIVDRQPYYEYAPFQCSEQEYEKWQEEMMAIHKDHTWNCNIYYRIDRISCVLVLRNKLWAAKAVETLRELWQTIEKERVEGYSHREPKTRTANVKPRQTSLLVKLDEDGEPIASQQRGPAPCLFVMNEDGLQTIETLTDMQNVEVTNDTDVSDNHTENTNVSVSGTKRPRDTDVSSTETILSVETEII
jgi:hypothetical protein